jgi:predicted DNA-binding transcriptional regulator YafY
MGKRSERLLALMQALRRRRRPVPGQVLAEETGVSLRSLYRDIDTLKSMGAAIDGEAGLGFQLRGDYFMPPLMFTTEELEAMVLGLRTAIYGPDSELASTARDALSKVAAVLPAARRDEMEAVGLFAVPRGGEVVPDPNLALLRTALRDERQLRLRYRDRSGAASDRVVYPLALGYYDNSQMLVAWCTLRQDFRSFRVSGMDTADVLDAPLPEPRRTLFHRWRTAHNLPDLT